ncbi:hypothetical protein [Stakelama pacifica]|uniref:Uncharacterized protein n=1 Tax=Stakelama pacifica TaxID=517720 RepID=A0A4R6FH68_9SPHN|nr:hypothetical protein [Stakelama pacifica]TDN80729.1 hypothetical protein EV664_109119 [Stakelama pacifica]GGO97312.1 hypothetical protein GCM10011329_25870 [Stakelama pacifica]
MRFFRGFGGRLYKHDSQLAINLARSVFARWQDRILALALLALCVALLRSRVSEMQLPTRTWIALAVGIALGWSAGQLLNARAKFHASDGVIASDALNPKLVRHFLIAFHVAPIALTIALVLMVMPDLVLFAVSGYGAGAYLAYRLAAFSHEKNVSFRWSAASPAIRALLRNPVIGAIAGALPVFAIALQQGLEPRALQILVTAEITILALLFTTVEYPIVAFMRVSGKAPLSIILYHIKGLAGFGAVVACLIWFGDSTGLAVTVVAIVLAAGFLIAIRILLYCIHFKAIGDLLTGLTIAAIMGAVVIAAPLAPVLMALLVWNLHRRASARTWLIT